MIDIEKPDELLAYLRRQRHIRLEETPVMTPLAGGVSNRTVLVRRATGEAWVLKQALEKLRVAMEWHASPERVHREALALRWLVRLAPAGATVRLVFEDHDNHVIAMEAVHEPNENWKTLLLAGRLQRDHVRQFGTLLGTIHRRGQAAGPELAAAFEDRSFFESLRLEPYYRTAAGRNPEAAGFLEQLMAETRATRLTFVHGDYSPKNILVHDVHLILLDFEVAHFGDPAFDLGFAFAHLLSKAHHLPAQRAAFLEAAGWFWRAYQDAAGDVSKAEGCAARAARHGLGCLLARVDGRSPLEYLTPAERDRQRVAVLRLIASAPATPPDLFAQFGKLLASSN
jgi:5-methylthioribose kinase